MFFLLIRCTHTLPQFTILINEGCFLSLNISFISSNLLPIFSSAFVFVIKIGEVYQKYFILLTIGTKKLYTDKNKYFSISKWTYNIYVIKLMEKLLLYKDYQPYRTHHILYSNEYDFFLNLIQIEAHTRNPLICNHIF